MIIPATPLRSRRGFTLLEMSIAVALSMAIGAMLIGLMQLQVSFHRILRAQQFIVKEAPLINNSLTHIMARADAFRIHESVSDAVADINAVTEDGSVLVVGFQNPDGSRDFGLISFESDSDGSYLGYYSVDPSVPFSSMGTPNWIISRSVTNATFFIENDIFRVRLTGPSGETIIYSGTPRL